MLNHKRIIAVMAATVLTVTVQSVVGLALSEENTYQNNILANILEANAVQASAAITSGATETSSVEAGVPYADDDPGRERLSGQAVLPEPEEDAADIFNLSKIRAISDYSPFMGNTPYFHSDAFANRKVVHGIDVSKYQKDIDWEAVAEAGVEYAFIRVGFRGYGKTGGMGADTYFEQNIKGALAADIDVGVYFFSQATTKKEAIEEAQYTLDKIKAYDIKLPVVMDFEYATVNGKEGGRLYDAGLSKEEATNVCLAFCETVEKAGYEPMVYANSSMLANKLNASDISSKYKIWLANYTSMTAYTGDYDFWQYSSKGTVNGITGNVDCNFWYQAAEAEKEEIPEENPVIIPNKVNGLAVGGRTNSRIRLNWESTEGATGYRIYRYDEAEDKYKEIKTLSDGTQTTWVDTTVEAGKIYQYIIKSYIKDENGTYWSEKSQPLMAKSRTSAVEGFTLTVARKDKVRLSWQQTEGANGYRIYRYNSKTKEYEKIKTIGAGDTITWVNGGLQSNTTYKYKIKAYIEVANGGRYASDYSDEVIAKTKK